MQRVIKVISVLVATMFMALAQASCYQQQLSCPQIQVVRDAILHLSHHYDRDPRIWHIWGETNAFETDFLWDLSTFVVRKGPYGEQISAERALEIAEALLRSLPTQFVAPMCDPVGHVWTCYYKTTSDNALVVLISNGQKLNL